MLQFFQNLNKNIIDIISWCRIQFKFFIYIIIIIYLLYNIGFISYMEENIDCFEECSLKDIDESILLKDIKELKNLKIEELNSEEEDIKKIKRIILYIIDILETIRVTISVYCILNLIFYMFRSYYFFYIYDLQIMYNFYFNDFLLFNKVYPYIKFFEIFILDSLLCYYLFGCCIIYEPILNMWRESFLDL